MIKAGYKQIKLDGKSAVETFCTADGLSLQSLFFALYNEFPSLYTYKCDEAHAGYFFDTQEILADLKNLYGEDGVQTVIYTVLNLQTDQEDTGLNIFLPAKKMLARIEKTPSETYVLYHNGSEADVEELTSELKKFYNKPAFPPNNVYTVSYKNSFYLN